MKKLRQLIFSRYTVSALAILIQVALMAYIFVSAAAGRMIFIIFDIIFSLAAFLHLVNRDTNPEYKIPWSFIILATPPVGACLYYIFYQRKLTRREVKRLKSAFLKLRRPSLIDGECEELSRVDMGAGGKARALLADDALAEVYRGTSARFYPTGEEYFADLIEDLRAAREYIFLEFFIIDEGELWNEIHTILKNKAAEGLEVRVLYDDVGCMRKLPSRYERVLRAEGISAYRFSRVSPIVSSIHNNRDHRKICIIDGRAGYTGGVNIADEYVNKTVRFGHWKDGGIRLSGDAVRGLLKLFLSGWDLTVGSESDYERYLGSVKPDEHPDGGFYIPYGTGPAPIYRSCVGKNVFLNLINQSENYIYITTPYLIIDYDLTEALRQAAVRGVDVRIITPGIPDKPLVYIMTKSSYPYLISAGVKIYEYIPGFIHEKTLVCDGEFAVVGTINLDYRSLVHHFEDAVWMYKAPAVERAYEEFLRTLELSERVDFELSRLTFTEWIFKMVARIFAPFL